MDGTGNILQARSIAQSTSAAKLDELQSSALHDSPAEAGRKFEALFATMLVKEMRGSLSEGFFGQGPQSDVYAGWLDQFVGESIARDGGLHIADGVRQGLERKQAAERAAQELALGATPSADGAPGTSAVLDPRVPAHGATTQPNDLARAALAQRAAQHAGEER